MVLTKMVIIGNTSDDIAGNHCFEILSSAAFEKVSSLYHNNVCRRQESNFSWV